MAEESAGRSQRRRARRRRAAAGVVGLVVVVGGGAAAFAATSGKGNGQRVATAAVASVTQTVESSGTIASARKSASAFSVSGTVNDVGVKVGDTVGKGQLLARLDASSLQTTVDTAAATLATAQQRLETDKTGQTSGSSGSGTSGSGTSGSSTSSTGTSSTGTSSTGTRAATTSYTTGSSTGSVTATEVDAVTSTSGGTSVSGLVKQIVAAQNAVTGGQKKVDATQSTIDTAQKTVNLDIAQNTKFRDAQQTSCAADVQADGATQPTSSSPVTSSAGPTPTASSTTAPSTAPSDSPSTTPPSSSPPSTVSAECASAMANYQAFAGTLSSDTGVLSGRISAQDGYLATLQTAMKKLDSLVGQLQKAAAGSGSGSGAPTTGPGQTKSGSGSGQTSKSGSQKSGGQTQSGQNKSGQSQSGQSQSGQSQSGQSKSGQSGQNQSGTSQSKTGQGQSGGSSSGSSGGSSGGSTAAVPASAAQLAADQAAIDAATAQLGVAKQSLSAATLTSPISGTVAAVGLTVGTASNGGTITVVGTGAQQADVTVPLGQIDQVKAGQSATLSVDGVTAKVHGTVQSVGVLSSTSGSSTTFPVTIALSSASPDLFDGSGADVVITTGTARSVLTVPNSAIHTIGSRQTVTVVDGGKTSTVPVTVGVSDSNRTQIKSGLKAGQQVVLADLSQPLPGTSTSANTGTGRFAGGFGGAGNIPNFGTGGRAGR